MGTKEKLIFAEKVLYIVWFWGLIYNIHSIKGKVVYVTFIQKERMEVILDFNNPESGLKVIILNYNVSAQGTKLQIACHRVITATSAGSLSAEKQASLQPSRVRTLLLELYPC